MNRKPGGALGSWATEAWDQNGQETTINLVEGMSNGAGAVLSFECKLERSVA